MSLVKTIFPSLSPSAWAVINALTLTAGIPSHISSASWLDADQGEPRVAQLLTQRNGFVREYSPQPQNGSSPDSNTEPSVMMMYLILFAYLTLLIRHSTRLRFLTAVVFSPHLKYLHTLAAIWIIPSPSSINLRILPSLTQWWEGTGCG